MSDPDSATPPASGSAQADAKERKAPGIPFEGERARAAARKRWDAVASQDASLDSPDALTEAEALRRMMKVQEHIALGKSKGATATQQTAAAKAWAELRVQLLGIEEEESATRYDLASLHDRLDLLDWVCSLDEEGMKAARTHVATLREEEGGTREGS